MGTRRRISLILAIAMIVTSVFTGTSNVYADEITVDSVEGTYVDSDSVTDDVVIDDAMVSDSIQSDEVMSQELLSEDTDAIITDETSADVLDTVDTADGQEIDVNDVYENDDDPDGDEDDDDLMTWEEFWKLYPDEKGLALEGNGGLFPDGEEYVYLDRPTKYLTGKDYRPEREGYAFTGWYKEEACTTLLSSQANRYVLNEVPEERTVIYAGWTEYYHEVTYDLGNGYLKGRDEDGNFKRVHTTTYKLLSGNSIAREDCAPQYTEIFIDDPHLSFKGFSETENGKQVDSHYKPEKDMTLYALWDEDRFMVTFDANGGYFELYDDETGKTLKESQKYEGFEVYQNTGRCKISTVPPKNSDPKKAFKGWFLDAACTKEPNWVNSNELKLDDDTTLYAGWEETDKIISFDPNGGYFYDEEENKKDSSPIKFGSSGKDYEDYNISNPVNPDIKKEFTGWCNDKAGKDIVFPAQDNKGFVNVHTLVSENKVYYAGWKDEYNVVTFDAGKGKFSYVDPDTYEELEASRATFRIVDSYGEKVPEARPYSVVIDDEDLIFEGWYEGDKKVDIWSYDYSKGKDVTFTAKYVPTFTLTTDPCGGYFSYWDYNEHKAVETTEPQTYKVAQGSSIKINRNSMKTPVHLYGKEFGGWYLDRKYTRYLGYSFELTPTSDMTIYAKWLDNYDVTFDAGEGTIDDSKSYSERVTEGDLLPKDTWDSCTGKIIAPEGKVFAGWFKDKKFEKPADRHEATTTPVTGPITYYAKFLKAYKVTFDVNGGEFVSGAKNPYAVEIAQGESIKGKAPTVKAAQDKAFIGWFEDKECTKKVENLYDYPITGDTTLYAGYTSDCYLITFKTGKEGVKFKNGSDTVTVSVPKGSAYRYGEDGNDYEYPFYAPELAQIPEGAADDDSWKLEGDDSGKRYYFRSYNYYYAAEDGTRQTDAIYGLYPTRNMTFTKTWATETVDLTFHANGGAFYEDSYYERGRMGDDNTEWVLTVPKGIRFWEVNTPYNIDLDDDDFYLSAWASDQDAQNEVDSMALIDSDMDFYAVWTESSFGDNTSFRIYYYAGEGYMGYFRASMTSVGYTEPYSPTEWYLAETADIDDDHRAFLTWCYDAQLTDPITETDIRRDDNRFYIRLKKDVHNLYAKFGDAYKVVFDANGGYFDKYGSLTKDPSEDMKNTTVLYDKVLCGHSLYISDHTQNIRRDDSKIFAGWYLDKACTKKAETFVWDNRAGDYFKPEGDVTLYAKWVDYKEVKSLSINAVDQTIEVGKSIKLEPVVDPENALETYGIQWLIDKSSADDVGEAGPVQKYPVIIKSDGTVIGQWPGYATIRASIHGVVSDPVTITVSDDDMKPTLSVSPTKLDITVKEKESITASIIPVRNETAITWKSSDESIVKVEGEGKAATVTGLKAGKATVTASWEQLSAAVEVKVEANKGVSFDKHEIYLLSMPDSTDKITATITGSEYSVDSLVWSTSNPDVATVNKGVVTASAGLETEATARITAKTPDGKYKDECLVTVYPGAKLDVPETNVIPGEVAKGTRIMLTGHVQGESIYYTTDGSDPEFDTAGKPFGKTKLYDDAIVIDKNMTIKAVAVLAGYDNSPVATYVYTVRQENWGDIDINARQAIFNNDLSKVPAGIWYRFDGENKAFTDSDKLKWVFDYTGEEQTYNSGISVYYGTQELEENRDYKITYSNNTDATHVTLSSNNAPAIKIKGKDNYEGSAVFKFTISPASMSSVDITGGTNLSIKDGKKLSTVKPSLEYYGSKLKKNTDYDLTFYEGKVTESVIPAGKTPLSPDEKAVAGKVYTAVISAHKDGNFSGTMDQRLTITAIDTSTAVQMSKVRPKTVTYEYDGNEPDLVELFKNTKVYKGTKVLEYGTDYTVEPVDKQKYPSYPDAGDYPVILHGTGIKETGTSYVGDKVVTLHIEGVDASEIKIASLNTRPEYTGRTIGWSDLYKDDGSGFKKPTLYYEEAGQKVVLKEDEDYTTDLDARPLTTGKFRLTFSLRGRYSGIISKKISIKSYKFDKDSRKSLKVTVKDTTYRGSGTRPEIQVECNNTVLREGLDYTLSFPGKPTSSDGMMLLKVNVKGKGNYSGTASREFMLEKADISKVTLRALDKNFSDKANNYKTSLKIYDGTIKLNKRYVEFDKNQATYINKTTGKVLKAGDKVRENDVIEVRLVVTCPETSPYKGAAELIAQYTVIDKDKNIKGSRTKIEIKDPEALVFADGEEIIPLKSSDLKVTVDGEVLDPKYYEVISVWNNRYVGKATIEIAGRNGYGGIKKQTFDIGKRKMNPEE